MRHVQVVGSDAVIAKSRERVVGARGWRETGSDAAREDLSRYNDLRFGTGHSVARMAGPWRPRTTGEGQHMRGFMIDVFVALAGTRAFQIARPPFNLNACAVRHAAARSPPAPTSAVNADTSSPFRCRRWMAARLPLVILDPRCDGSTDESGDLR